MYLLLGMRSEQSECLAPRRISTADSSGGVFYNQAASRVQAALLCSQKVRVRSDNGSPNVSAYILEGWADYTYAGLPLLTSSAVTKTSGGAIPAALKAELAYVRVAEVQMPQTALGSLAPGRSYERNISKLFMTRSKAFTSSIMGRTPGSGTIPAFPSLFAEVTMASSNRSASLYNQRFSAVDGEFDRVANLKLFWVLYAAVNTEVLHGPHTMRSWSEKSIGDYGTLV